MKNNKGFTLIEIIVSIAIGSVSLILIGSILISSFDLFGQYSNSKLKKDALDNIVDYVNSQLKNSTEVCYASVQPDDTLWHWLYIEDGRLYEGSNPNNNEGKKLFDDVFYNGSSNKLSMKFHNYKEAKIRMVIDYTLSNSKETYKKGDTIVFSNMNKSNQSDYGNESLKVRPTSTGDFNLNDNGDKKIYYKINENESVDAGSKKTIINPDDTEYTGTIEDKMYLITPHMNRGYFEANTEAKDNYFKYSHNVHYYFGDCVYYQGSWYMNISSDNFQGTEPMGYGWQKLEKRYIPSNYYTEGDIVVGSDDSSYRWDANWMVTNVDPTSMNQDNSRNWTKLVSKNTLDNAKTYIDDWNNGNSKYALHDYVKYGNKYYERIKTTDFSNSPSKDATDWRLVDALPDAKSGNIYKGKLGNTINQIENIKMPKNSPFDLRKNYLGDKTFDPWDHTYSGIKEYDNNTQYKKGDVCKIRHFDDPQDDPNPYYQLYVKIFDTTEQTAPGIKNGILGPNTGMASGWMLLENQYEPYSSYVQGATVRMGSEGTNTSGDNKDYRRVFGGDLFKNESNLALLDQRTTDYLNEKIRFYGYYTDADKTEDDIKNNINMYNKDADLKIYQVRKNDNLKYSMLTYVLYDNNNSLNGDLLNSDPNHQDLNTQIWYPVSANESQ